MDGGRTRPHLPIMLEGKLDKMNYTLWKFNSYELLNILILEVELMGVMDPTMKDTNTPSAAKL